MTRFLLAALVLGAATGAAAQSVRPVDLRVEHLEAPLGLDAAHPRLSWRLAPADTLQRGQRQTAYRIRVGTGTAGDVWDSGRVESAQQHLVPVGGRALRAGEALRWTVEVWDEAGRASAPAASEWTTGRMGDWGAARWIGLDSLLSERIGLGLTGTPRLRRDVTLAKPVARAALSVVGLGAYEVLVNGQRVSDDRLGTGWTDTRHTILYRTYDVTAMLAEGANALGIGLGGGHYRIPRGGPLAENRYAKFWDTQGPFQAILRLDVTYADGTTETVATDGAWQVGASPTVFSSIWGGEDFDARLDDGGAWARPGFSGAGWAPAMEMAGPAGALVGQTNPPIRAHETFRPVATTEPTPGVFVVDLGQNHAGMPRLRVRGAAGQTVTLRPSEVLAADGTVDQTSLKHWGEVVFRYTAAGRADDAWQPRYTYTGYRYLQVEGAAFDAADAAARGVPLVLGLESDFVYADAPVAGTFWASDPTVDGVHRMILGAVRSNFMGVLTDCPHREKLGWLEEAYLMGPSVLYNLDAATLYAKWLRDMTDAQGADGLVPTTAPEYTYFGGNFRDSPEWGSAVVQVPRLVYTWAGDAQPAADHYDAMARYVDYLDSRREPDGTVRHGLGDWYDIGPNFPGESQLTSTGITATATQAANLSAMAEMAADAGHAADAGRYRARFSNTRVRFNRAFWRGAAGHYDTGSQTAQAMPLVVGLATGARADAALETLVQDVTGRGYHPTAGDVGHRYFIQALAEAGRGDVLWRLATQTAVPSYGAQLVAGATTLTEAWDANPVQSQNHFMLGHIEEWFYGGLAGLKPAAPGWARFTVRPDVVGDLAAVRATHVSPYGEALSAWTRSGNTLTLRVTVPVGATARIEVPAASREAVREGGVPAAEAQGLTFAQALDGRAVYEAAPGHYVFTSELP